MHNTFNAFFTSDSCVDMSIWRPNGHPYISAPRACPARFSFFSQILCGCLDSIPWYRVDNLCGGSDADRNGGATGRRQRADIALLRAAGPAPPRAPADVRIPGVSRVRG